MPKMDTNPWLSADAEHVLAGLTELTLDERRQLAQALSQAGRGALGELANKVAPVLGATRSDRSHGFSGAHGRRGPGARERVQMNVREGRRVVGGTSLRLDSGFGDPLGTHWGPM
jgi:hypothetical protein